MRSRTELQHKEQELAERLWYWRSVNGGDPLATPGWSADPNEVIAKNRASIIHGYGDTLERDDPGRLAAQLDLIRWCLGEDDPHCDT